MANDQARDHSRLQIGAALEPLPESPLELSLIQLLAKAEAMDLIVQKTTELGVRTVIPVVTEFSVVKLDGERRARRVKHWQKIARSACEQSGRHCPPVVCQPQSLASGLAGISTEHLRFALHPDAEREFGADIRSVSSSTGVAILIGPEGGLSDADLKQADQAGFTRVTLRPRVLRAETAALAACTLAQSLWGDLFT